MVGESLSLHSIRVSVLPPKSKLKPDEFLLFLQFFYLLSHGFFIFFLQQWILERETMDFRGIGKNGEIGDGLVRQPSIFALTMEEFQNSIGTNKDFGSMNMDELLRSIWTAEETQAMTLLAGANGGAAATSLQRQPSLTLPRTLSQKTVDEVLKDLFKENAVMPQNPNLGQALQSVQRQPTLGEITLEEFLFRAGLGREEQDRAAISGSSLLLGEPSTNQMVNGGPRIFVGSGQMEMAAGRVTLAAAPPAPPASGFLGDEDSSSGGGRVEMGMRGRRHGGVGLERVVERRQRRMIKNRESAARSRARKQAYTMELEAEITKLKEQNAQLQKKQAEFLMKQKNQTMEKMNQPRGPKKQCLRRTLTGPW